MVKKKKVVWDELARTALREAYSRIKRDSLQQAEKVKQEILAASKKLADHPEMYPTGQISKGQRSSLPCF